MNEGTNQQLAGFPFKKLAEEYKSLLQESEFSIFNAERIEEILVIALDSDVLTLMIREADKEISAEDENADEYWQHQRMALSIQLD
ncbi:MAG: hypothetical protein AAGJ80_20730, partial [Cyanobacteria bacterium J06553_1]